MTDGTVNTLSGAVAQTDYIDIRFLCRSCTKCPVEIEYRLSIESEMYKLLKIMENYPY